MKCLLTIVLVFLVAVDSHRKGPPHLKCAEEAGVSQETMEQLKTVFVRPTGRPRERPTPEQMNATMQEHQAKVRALITDATQLAAFEKCMMEMRPKFRKERGSPPPTPEPSAESTTAGGR